MSALLQLVVDNSTSLECGNDNENNQLTHNQPKIKLARTLLERASMLLCDLGSGYSSVSSIIDECKEMLGRRDCEPFANLAQDQSLEDLP